MIAVFAIPLLRIFAHYFREAFIQVLWLLSNL
jgi:hypothetical protein